MFRYRWIIILMLFLANAINYTDRSAMSVALPLLSKQYHLTPSQAGMILSSFFIGYAIFNFVGGYMSDKKGPRLIMGTAMTAWSLFCGLTAATFNFISLFIVRLFFGFGEGPLTSTTNKAMNNWIPLKERARAVGIANAGAPLGGAVSGPIVALISLHWGWKCSFIVLAIVGLIWVIFWFKVSRDKPEMHPKVTKAELKEIIGEESLNLVNNQKAVAKPAVKTSLFTILKQPKVAALAVGMFGYNYTLFFFLTWFPSYLMDARHLSVGKMGIVSVLPWIAGGIGQIVGSIIIDYIYKVTGKAVFSRKIVLVTCLIASAICVALTGLASTVITAVTLMTFGICFLYLQATTYWAIIQDVVPSDKVGGTSGFVHAIANISGIIGPTVTGFIVQYSGHYTAAFILAGGLAIIGALGVAFFVKSNMAENLDSRKVV
ncbi:hexuronate transporter [Heyndrickxia ginsengihumi]|uniref:Hexuronate transporter n=1 Tax=Heyndrickxia ginsengihumi TaxID=363870 RepID=A0A0A6XZP0_9BACI|nr:MFS transporter [Heyndrickxia ginsengihumi]KHD85582.1 hexuronate transporter [Heyndrickxia ginsengihumi]